MDVTAFIGGYHGDLNETFCVGEVREGGNALRDRKGGGCTQCWLGGQQVQHKVSPCTFSQVVQDNLAVMLLPPPHCPVSQVDEGSKALVRCAHDSLMAAVAAVKPGVRFRDLGDIISKHVSNAG